MAHKIMMVSFAVMMTAFAVFNCARCLADAHYAVGVVFGFMAFGGVCFACALWDEMAAGRKKRHKDLCG